MVRLDELCVNASSSIAQKDLAGKNGIYPIYGASGFIQNVDFYKQSKPYIAIVKDGAGVGRVMKLPAESSVIGTMQYILPKDHVDVDYLAYALESMNLAKYYTGATIPHIYFKDYRQEQLPEHSFEEQIDIAQVLNKVSDLIFLRKQQLLKFDELVKARFIEMFGDPILNQREWEVCSVIEKCGCMVPERDKPKSFTGSTPWITIEDLNVNGVTFKSKSGLGLTNEEIKEVKRKTIPVGSVIMSCVGNLGICSIAGCEMVINQQLHAFQCGEEMNNIFLMHYLSSRKDYMEKNASSTTVLYMNKRVCNTIPIIVPPIELQNKFADFVKQSGKSKFKVQKNLDELELLKKSLMQKYFK